MSPRFLHLTVPVTSGSWKCSHCLIFSHAANVDVIWKLEFSLAIKLTLRKVETVFIDCNYGLTCGGKCPWEFSPQFIHRASLLWWNIYYVILDNYCLFLSVFLLRSWFRGEACSRHAVCNRKTTGWHTSSHNCTHTHIQTALINHFPVRCSHSWLKQWWLFRMFIWSLWVTWKWNAYV